MVEDDKVGSALRALNLVLVVARKMAYDEAPWADIAKVLDVAEYLPLLIAARDDRTDAFREHLVHLAELAPAFAIAVEEFDRGF